MFLPMPYNYWENLTLSLKWVTAVITKYEVQLTEHIQLQNCFKRRAPHIKDHCKLTAISHIKVQFWIFSVIYQEEQFYPLTIHIRSLFLDTSISLFQIEMTIREVSSWVLIMSTPVDISFTY